MAVNGQLSADVTSSVVQTTDGSSTVQIYSTPAFLADDGGQLVTFDVCGFDFINDEIATAKIVVKLKNVSGTPTMIGTPIHLVPISAGSSQGLTTAAIDVIIDGTNIEVNAIGVTGRTIDWTVNRYPSLSVLNNWTAVPTPEDGYLSSWIDARSRWEPVSPTVAIVGAVVGGDLSGTLPNPSVSYLNGASVPQTGGAGDNRTVGNVLQAIGEVALGYGPVNLAGGANYVTGVLPKANQGSQDMAGDVTGTTAASIVERITGLSNAVILGGVSSDFTVKNTQSTVTNNLIIQGANSSAAADGGGLWLTAGAASGIGGSDAGIVVIGRVPSGSRQTDTLQFDCASYNFISPPTSGTASSGAATLPANPVGFLVIQIDGTPYKIPYYN